MNGWNVSQVRDMAVMFAGASSFNQPLHDWDVRNVVDMGAMFMNASSFNYLANRWKEK